jgi:Transcription factor WhiB
VRDWVSLAACAGENPDWWGDDATGHVEAVRICLGCPVRQPCLAEAVNQHEIGVIRGGLWFGKTRNGYVARSPVCGGCGMRPVSLSLSDVNARCTECRVKANRARRRARRQAAIAGVAK